MLLGLSALMDILPGAIDGFELYPHEEQSILPCFTNNRVEGGFPGSTVLAFKYFLVRDTQNRVVQSLVSIPEPSLHRFNEEEDYKP
jgi:hypothetical protein